jgi:hypothetical protein
VSATKTMFPQQGGRLIQVCLIWCWNRMLCKTIVTVFLKAVLTKNVVLLEEPQTTISLTHSVSVLWVIGVSGIPLVESTLHLTTESQLLGSIKRTFVISGDN